MTIPVFRLGEAIPASRFCIFLNRARCSELVLAAPISFDLFADAVIETQKIFVSQIFDCHKHSPKTQLSPMVYLSAAGRRAKAAREGLANQALGADRFLGFLKRKIRDWMAPMERFIF
jgi:hypothetical protein